MNKTAYGTTRCVWEVEGTDRLYSIDVSKAGLIHAEGGPPPGYGCGGRCTLRQFLAGAQHAWIIEFMGREALEEALAFARELTAGGRRSRR